MAVRPRFSRRYPPSSSNPRWTTTLAEISAEDLAASPIAGKMLAVATGAATVEWVDAAGGGPHTHAIADTTGLQATLDGKAATSHAHADVIAAGASGYMTGADKSKLDAISGTNTGDQTSVSGNAGTASALQTARNINGVAFNGSADITVAAAGSTLTGTTIAAAMLGATASTACAGNDARLSDARAPLAHNQAISTVTGLQTALDGKSDVGHTHGASMTTLKTTSHQTINGTAFQDVTGLTFPVSINTDYAFKFHIVFQSTLATGFRFAINGPAGATCEYHMRYQTVANSTTAGVATWLEGHWVVYDTMTALTSTIAAAVDLVCIIEGRIMVNGTGGTLAARVASEAANNDLTVRKGSWGFWF